MDGYVADVTAGSRRRGHSGAMRRAPLHAVTAAAALLVVSCAPAVDLLVQAPATASREPGGHETAVVTRVVDGDTVEVRVTGRVDGPAAGDADIGGRADVRLLGIDTPESVAPGRPVECYGREASSATAALLDGAAVRLVADVEERDGFGRLLRYVYVGDEMANARLVVNGYATAYPYEPNVRHAALLAALERDARRHDRGLWAPATCSGPS